ncbi:angiopoietin-related protein 7-like [Ylistrum balloti]|uniref:angiopoietin-related protein 7-like n=1 Tax=Ylistrum balloti TaxID=509963 RepID=UPI002905BFE7|nr:angiopoietin-related protein 7-like [Ylistrum balloti]
MEESLVDCGDLSCFECSGVYRITPVPGTSFDVYCDTETSGGPWTVIQRRFDGSVNFTRNWEDYKRGFGTPYGEYWLAFRKRNDLRSSVQLLIGLLLSFFINTTLGLEYIHSLLTLDQRLNVKLEGWDGTVRTAAYRKFIIESESDLYQLTIDGFTGDVDDQLTQHNRQRFSTYDRDNDLRTGGSCADSGRGGWWYKNCYTANLNGVYAFDKGIDVSLDAGPKSVIFKERD